MAILDWFKNRFRHEADHYLYVPIPAVRVSFSDGSSADNEPLVAGVHYFRVWLVEMYLKNDRDWFSGWHPAAHAAVTFQFGGETQVLTNVVSQSKQKDLIPKDLGASDLDRFVTMNRELTGLLPFNDGTVTVDAGLLGMQGNSDVKNLIKAMGTFGTLLAVPQLSVAVKVAAPLADAMASLVGATDGNLMIGLSQTFSEQGGGGDAVFRGGYYAMIDATAAQLNPDKFWVKQDHLQYGDTLAASGPVSGHNYLLLRVERRENRNDWDDIGSIHGPYQEVLKALQSQKVDEADVHLRTTIAAVLAAPELTKKVDRRRVVQELKAKYEQDKKDLGAGAFRKAGVTLQSVMNDAEPASAVARKPEMTEREAFAGLP